MKKISNRLKSNKGETIAETLVSTVIAALMILLLVGAIVTAAKINGKTKNQKTDFDENDAGPPISGVIEVSMEEDSVHRLAVNADYYLTNTEGDPDKTQYCYFKLNEEVTGQLEVASEGD